MTVLVASIVIAFVWTASLITNIRLKEFRKFMSEQSDKITAAFDAYKADVSAKLAALAAAVKPGMTDAEAQAVLDDISAAKTALDATPTT